VLTGDTAAGVEEAAKASTAGATVIRVETDAEGRLRGAYPEGRADNSDVKLDASINVTGTEAGKKLGLGGALPMVTLDSGYDILFHVGSTSV